MYNEEIKNRFILEELPADHQKKIYKSIFFRTKDYESLLGKDIYWLSTKECMALLVDLNPNSLTAVSVYKSQFVRYVDWAIKNKLVKNNYWSIVSPDEDFARTSFSMQYIKDIDELKNIIDTSLEVRYDKYLVYLLYMGIMGENFAELAGLRDNDIKIHQKMINTKKRIHGEIITPLYDLILKTFYSIELNYKDGRLIRRIFEEKDIAIQYFNAVRDGEISNNTIAKLSLLENNLDNTILLLHTEKFIRSKKHTLKSFPYMPEGKNLRDEASDFFIKPFLSKGIVDKKVSVSHVYNTFLKINNNYFKKAGEKKLLTPISVFKSGMLDAMRKIELVKNNLTNEDIRNIRESYGMFGENIGVFRKEYELWKDIFH